MNIKANIEAVKRILKFVPQQYKKDTLSAVPAQPQKNGKAQKETPKENLSRNDLKEKLREKIQQIRQKKGVQTKEDDDDEKNVPIIKKRIRKPKPSAPRREKGPNYRAEKKRARLLNEEKTQDKGKSKQNKKDQRNKKQKKGQKQGENKVQNKGQNKVQGKKESE
jgi:hypothetical protein